MADVGLSQTRGQGLAARSGAGLGPLGILGGGQLGRMTIEAAGALGLDVVVAERSARSPAARMAAHEVLFPAHTWDDDDALVALARLAPIVTLENEFVDAAVLEKLAALGTRVVPSPRCVGVVQDKLRQKRALAAAGISVAPFRAVADPAELDAVGGDLGWPLMLKARRDGYDGYGNALVRTPREAVEAARRLGWPERTLYVEAVLRFERELAVMVVRGQDGREVATYPVVETRQDPTLHVCRVVAAPAVLEEQVAREATRVARSAVEAVGGSGTFGVELFLLRDGSVCVNELAPRPHNSGHYSIEACATSQFSNHVRAVLGLPLGDVAMRSPAAVMVNLLGSGPDRPPLGPEQLSQALRVPNTYVHLYGKAESRPGRKMGHVTALGANLEEAYGRAQRAAGLLPV